MAVEKTEAEKIAMCTAFLQKRGFTVIRKYISIQEVAAALGVTTTHARKLDIPRLNVGAFGADRKSFRFDAADVLAWIERKKEAAK
jgi:hypothetical protein